jgi:signal transduction histidine kinase
VLVMMNDVTKLRRLESVGRDFAANHEFRAPSTSIRRHPQKSSG